MGGGGETDWVGKELTSQFFPPGKELTSQFFPRGKTGRPILSPGKKLTGEKTDRHTGVTAIALCTSCSRAKNLIHIHTILRLCFLPNKVFSFVL